MQHTFPDWYTDSKRILAVKGDEHFSQSMIDIYTNLANHMYDDGIQVVMFTHSDPSVWAQLALIMWKAGLKVTAAWNIAIETDASGLKETVANHLPFPQYVYVTINAGSEYTFSHNLGRPPIVNLSGTLGNLQLTYRSNSGYNSITVKSIG